MDPTTIAILVGSGSLLSTIVGFVITWLKDGRQRRWEIEDRRLAAEARAQLAVNLEERLKEESEERLTVARGIKQELFKNTMITKRAHADIAQKIDKGAEFAKEAITVANGHNQKIEDLTRTVAAVPVIAATAAVAAVQQAQPVPAQVEVVNPLSPPIPVTQSEPQT